MTDHDVEHYVAAYYTTDDDGIWLSCAGCPWRTNAGYFPLVDTLKEISDAHKREAEAGNASA